MVQDAAAKRSLQERFAPGSRCFGCGPVNQHGLRIRSFRGDGDSCFAMWMPRPEHEAFPGVLNGGIIGTLLDCHSNWTAAVHLMGRNGLDEPAVTVTAAFDVRLLRPTPSGDIVRLAARVVESAADRAVVESTLSSAGRTTATGRATFVVVRAGHPAYDAWTESAKAPSSSETSAGR